MDCRRHKKVMKVNILKMVIDVWNDVGVSAEMELVRYTSEWENGRVDHIWKNGSSKFNQCVPKKTLSF